jgi:hypothetical protein
MHASKCFRLTKRICAIIKVDEVVVVAPYSYVIRAKPVEYTDISNAVHILTRFVYLTAIERGVWSMKCQHVCVTQVKN